VSKAKAAPTYDYEDVAAQVRRAMHDPDPLERAEASAWLAFRRLPVSPRAIIIAATVQIA